MRCLFFLCLLAVCTLSPAAPGPYDEAADSPADIQAVLAHSRQSKLPVLVVFGANSCGDCKMLDGAFKAGVAAPLIAKHFHVVKVDVGKFDHNLAIADAYGIPLKKGIPAVAVLSSEGKPLYVTRGGELADARAMGDIGVYDFFAKIVGAPSR